MKFLLAFLLSFVTPSVFAKAGGHRPQVVTLDPATTVSLLGVVTVSSVSTLLAEIAEMDAKGVQEITMVIDSPGGYVYPGLRLVAALQNYQAKGQRLRCVVTGQAASMAYYLLGACGERLVFARSQLLWHPIRVSGGDALTGEVALAIGQSLLSFEQAMKEELISTMRVDPDWFDMHWRAETTHHGSDLAHNAPSFVRVIRGVQGLPMSRLFWIQRPSLMDLLGQADSSELNGERYWGK